MHPSLPNPARSLAAIIPLVIALALLPACIVRTEVASGLAFADGGGRTVTIGDSDWPEPWTSDSGQRGIVLTADGPLSVWRGVHCQRSPLPISSRRRA